MRNSEYNHTRIRITVFAAALCLAGSLAQAQEGTLDTTFSSDGLTTVAFDIPGSNYTDVAYDSVVQPDGKIVLVGAASRNTSSHNYSVVARLNPDGTLDTSFGTGGRINFYFGDEYQRFSAVALQGSKIIAGGWHRFTDPDHDVNFRFHVVRFYANGNLDGSFGPSTSGSITIDFDDISPGKKDYLWDLAVQPDGKIVLVGEVTAAAGDSDIGVVRLTAEGELDTTFDSDGRRVLWFDEGGNDNDKGVAVTIQPDGKIVILATVDIDIDNTDFGVKRLLSDGSNDCTFGGTCAGILVPFDAGAPSHLIDIAYDVQMMGRKIVLAGTTDSVNGDMDMCFARLNNNGSLDTTFGENNSGKRRLPINDGGYYNDVATAISVRGNGDLVATGVAWNASDADMAFARLNLDGSVDINFGDYGQKLVAFDFGGDDVDVAYGVGIQKDGKIVAAGRVGAEYSSTDADMGVVRLHQGDVLFSSGFETADLETWTTNN